jgi:hypothetical protein
MSDPTTRALEELAEMRAQLSDQLAACVIEKAVLKSRVAALESQVSVLEQAAIDQKAHAVYRRAAVMVSSYVEAARGSSDEVHRRRALSVWGDVADQVDEQLLKERVH